MKVMHSSECLSVAAVELHQYFEVVIFEGVAGCRSVGYDCTEHASTFRTCEGGVEKILFILLNHKV